MSSRSFPFYAAILTTILLIGSAIALLGEQAQKQKGKQKPAAQAPKPPARTVQAPVQEPKPKKGREEESAGAPRISLSVNGLQEAIGLTGKAILIEAAVVAPREEAEVVALTLSKPGAFWGEMFAIEVRDGRGQIVTGFAPRLITTGDPTVALDSKQYGWLVWVLEAPSLQAGQYRFRVLLDSTASAGDGWKGKAWSPPAKLEIKAASSSLSADEKRLAVLTEARVFGALGRLPDALAACDRFLQDQPNDALVLSEKGDILSSMGKHQDAVAAYDRALSIDAPLEEGAVPEAPFQILRKRDKAAEAASKSPKELEPGSASSKQVRS